MSAFVVLDTNALLDLWVFDDPRCALLRDALASGTLRLACNAACRDEFLRVLHYPVLALDDTRCAALAARLDATCEFIDIAARDIALPRCKDPDDQKFLELARDAGARLLVTRDNELLKLSRRTLRAAGFGVTTPDGLTSVLG